ncbi:serine/threonine-protein kinase [Anaerolineales bacterium HSG25]|nr:serine/threonine-protein kinase [Anaerolineales bacterium HSG25]
MLPDNQDTVPNQNNVPTESVSTINQRSDFIGQQIDNRYKIIRSVGQGAMATVYKAEDINLKTHVAIKMIHSHLLSKDEQFIKRFKREAKILDKLDHSHIVGFRGYGEWKDFTYIAMRFIKGKSLEKCMRQFSLQEIYVFIEHIGSALDYAHSKGIIHRDIKPSNILIDNKNKYLLTDFGIATMVDVTSLTHTDQNLGTLKYMSPEQYKNLKIDKRSDIYSLGLILYEMVGGELPKIGSNLLKTGFEFSSQSLEPSELIEDVIRTTLSEEPSKRYQTCEALLNAFKKAMEGSKADVELLRGNIVGGEYCLIEIIPSGGAGQVWKAKNIDDDSEVCIKLTTHRGKQHNFYERAVECQGLIDCENNHIVEIKSFEKMTVRDSLEIYNIVEYEIPYVVMLYIHGSNLTNFFNEHRDNLDEVKIINFFEQLCKALKYAHEQGICHHNLNPMAILIEKNNLYLTGFAHVGNNKDCYSIGTKGYQAPEQKNKGELDKRTDIYVAGIILHQFCTGRLPSEKIYEIRWPFRNIIKKCLENDPNNRYQSIDEMSKGYQWQCFKWLTYLDLLSDDLIKAILRAAQIELPEKANLAVLITLIFVAIFSFSYVTDSLRNVTKEIYDIKITINGIEADGNSTIKRGDKLKIYDVENQIGYSILDNKITCQWIFQPSNREKNRCSEFTYSPPLGQTEQWVEVVVKGKEIFDFDNEGKATIYIEE